MFKVFLQKSGYMSLLVKIQNKSSRQHFTQYFSKTKRILPLENPSKYFLRWLKIAMPLGCGILLVGWLLPDERFLLLILAHYELYQQK